MGIFLGEYTSFDGLFDKRGIGYIFIGCNRDRVEVLFNYMKI